MPTGYAGEGKTYSRSLGKWVTKSKTTTFDYANIDNKDSAALILSVFTWYPDVFLDIIADENAQYPLEFPQRLMLRTFARYLNVFITGCRGITKTYCLLLAKMCSGIFFPNVLARYNAPNQKQAAALATQAFHQIEKSYSLLASWWKLRNDRSDMFRIVTPYGSEFTMYTVRGDNTHEVCGEEVGQEGDFPFPIKDFIENILPTVRLERRVRQKIDKVYGDPKHYYIGNATSKTNQAYLTLRKECLKQMITDKPGEEYKAMVYDLSWETALLCNIRGVSYFKDLKATLSPEAWLRECCARYTGTGNNPMLTDEELSRARKLLVAETEHCGDPNCIYIVSHDDASVDRQHNAKCADTVTKLTRYQKTYKRDKYRKQVVFVDIYAPPATAYLRARRLKQTWQKYCLNGGNATYLVVDTRNAGIDVVSELMKPMNDGLASLSCIDGFNAQIEQPNAVRCLYPMQSSRGGKNDEGAMIDYIRSEFQQGNVELLTGEIRRGIEAYKITNGIKDDTADSKIVMPYRNTGELCEQVQNLKIEASGTGIKEKRKNPSIPRDAWSSVKYAFRVARMLEEQLVATTYRPKSSLQKAVEEFNNAGGTLRDTAPHVEDTRSRLLRLRRR